MHADVDPWWREAPLKTAAAAPWVPLYLYLWWEGEGSVFVALGLGVITTAAVLAVARHDVAVDRLHAYRDLEDAEP